MTEGASGFRDPKREREGDSERPAIEAEMRLAVDREGGRWPLARHKPIPRPLAWQVYRRQRKAGK